MFVWSKFVLWCINNWLHVQLKLPSTAARGLHEWGYFLSGCLDCSCWDWLCKLLYAWNVWRLGWMSEEEWDNLFCYKIIFLSILISWVGGLHSCRPGNNLQVVLCFILGWAECALPCCQQWWLRGQIQQGMCTATLISITNLCLD